MSEMRVGHTALTWDVLANPIRLRNAIEDCAELGYQGIETGGRVYDWWEQAHPGELSQLIADTGLTLVSLFQAGDWTDAAKAPGMITDAQRWAEAICTLGGEILMLVPGPRQDDSPMGIDAFKQMAASMNRVGQVAREAGVTAAMHPHWGTTAETRLEIEVLLDHLDDDLVGFAPDTGQIAKGGTDPLVVVERWAHRVRYIHLKDLSPRWDEMRRNGESLRSPAGYAPLGMGTLDFLPILQALEQADYRGWLMTELDEVDYAARQAALEARTHLEQALQVWSNR